MSVGLGFGAILVLVVLLAAVVGILWLVQLVVGSQESRGPR